MFWNTYISTYEIATDNKMVVKRLKNVFGSTPSGSEEPTNPKTA